jgi:hypothetical protein
MKAKVSKAQLEVWEWKERASEKLLSLPEEERLSYISETVRTTIEEIKKKRERLPA